MTEISHLVVYVNGESVELAAASTLSQLLAQLEITTRHVAVELNLEIIPFEKHAECVLADGDKLEVVTLVGGG
jgi:thiamine biosynthesis protein ThiS|tara:strand:- start:119 stop:337 length:219 start_codon:yes stop_codon:yes gene_type:complete